MKRFIAVVSILLLLLVGCGRDANVSDTAGEKTAVPSDYAPVTIDTVDSDGKPVEQTFEKMPEKVLCVYQSAIENMLALGLEDKIVTAAMLDIPVKEEYKEAFGEVEYMEDAPSKEAVLAMEPDMILSWSSYFTDKMLGDVRDWHKKGVHTYILKNSGAVKSNRLENEFDDILALGKIFHKEDVAEQIVRDMRTRLEETEKARAGKPKVTAVILEIEDENLFRNYGKDTVGGEIALKAGAELPIEGDRFGAEELIEKDPEAIFVVYFGEEKTEGEQLACVQENPALRSLRAVQEDRVYPVSLSEVYASGVRTADGIETIVKGLYPAL